MRNLILLLLGAALFRWLTSPAEPEGQRQRLHRTGDTGMGGTRRIGSSFAEADTSSDQLEPGRQAASPTSVTYRVVEHDGGWAYKVGDVFSETFPDHQSALEAAKIASREHQITDEPVPIEYQDAGGKWRQEMSTGRDRPKTQVEDSNS